MANTASKNNHSDSLCRQILRSRCNTQPHNMKNITAIKIQAYVWKLCGNFLVNLCGENATNRIETVQNLIINLETLQEQCEHCLQLVYTFVSQNSMLTTVGVLSIQFCAIISEGLFALHMGSHAIFWPYNAYSAQSIVQPSLSGLTVFWAWQICC